jgi:hypothetical protein
MAPPSTECAGKANRLGILMRNLLPHFLIGQRRQRTLIINQTGKWLRSKPRCTEADE